MIQEWKDLLLKDLCMRLPYGVKAEIKYHDDAWKLLAIYTNGTTYAARDIGYPIETYFEDCKPYLFPMSSITKEQDSYIYFNTKFRIDMFGDLVLKINEDTDISDYASIVDWLNKNHFDYRGLIEKGLAIDATGLNIY